MAAKFRQSVDEAMNSLTDRSTVFRISWEREVDRLVKRGTRERTDSTCKAHLSGFFQREKEWVGKKTKGVKDYRSYLKEVAKRSG